VANPTNLGFARANNQALVRCTGDYALLLNSDARLTANTVARLCAVMEQEPRAAAVAPTLLNVDGSFQAGPNDDLSLWNQVLLTLGLARFFRGGRYPGYGADAPRGMYAWVGGTCLLLRRAAWEQIGVLDPDYFFYTEEADWCWRARQAGWNVWYEPAARAIHLGGASSRRASDQMRGELYKSKLIFFQKHRPRWQAFVLRSLFLLTASAKAAFYATAARVNEMRAAAWRERAASFRTVVDVVKTVPV
jgi:GT2 family glycosyltransferase